MSIIAGVFCFLIIGACSGWFLAKQGVTAANALTHYQSQVYLITSIVLGLGTLIVLIMVAGKRSPLVPSFLLLYVGAYFWNVILFLCCFCTGFLIGLEKNGWQNPQRLKDIIIFLVVSIPAILFLLYQNLPINNLIEAPRILDGVVLQTTPYSCAAASIATVVHQVKPEMKITELDVVKLAGTSRQGTTILAAIQAMEKLGLHPQYHRNLRIKDLVDRQQIAILHVMEPVGAAEIQHAIVLLNINSAQQSLTVANPLYGKQVKTFAEMKDYWLEDAIFVTTSPD